MTEQEYEEAVTVLAQYADTFSFAFRCPCVEHQNALREWIKRLLSLTWPSGQPVIGVLAKDQTFPDPLYPESGALYRNGHEDARFVALDAGFRRVIQEKR